MLSHVYDNYFSRHTGTQAVVSEEKMQLAILWCTRTCQLTALHACLSQLVVYIAAFVVPYAMFTIDQPSLCCD